jgi:hypothetical protein
MKTSFDFFYAVKGSSPEGYPGGENNNDADSVGVAPFGVPNSERSECLPSLLLFLTTFTAL